MLGGVNGDFCDFCVDEAKWHIFRKEMGKRNSERKQEDGSINPVFWMGQFLTGNYLQEEAARSKEQIAVGR